MAFFEKYAALTGKPNGRPVGVRNGQGQQPMAFENPMLKGMAQTPTPLSTSVAPAPVRQKVVPPGPPALSPDQTYSLSEWAKHYLGGR